MNTFSYIVHKLHSLTDEQYHFDFTDVDINVQAKYMELDIGNSIKLTGSYSRCSLTQNMMFQVHNNTLIKPSKGKLHKFEYLKMVNGLSFVIDDVKKYVCDMHTRAQRHYNALCRFANLYRIKNAPLLIHTDLYMNELTTNSRNTITIFQNKQRYLFALSDLNKIIETSLCNSPYFISTSLPVKNPYNQVPFSKSDLYNIYFKIKEYFIRMPDVLYQFFRSNFSLTHFSQNNQILIREKYINQFFENEDELTLA